MSKFIPSQRVKRPGSDIASASGNEAKKRSRKPIEIPEDIWLEALKHLICQKWSKMRLVSGQLNGMVERNVSRLPLAFINSAEIRLNKRIKTEVEMIVFNSTILPNKKNQWFKDQGLTEKGQWFMDRDIALDLPVGIHLNNPILGVEFKKNRCADLCILGTEQVKKLTRFEKTLPWFTGQQFKTEVLFYAEFSPHRNKYSCASMTFFLKMLYDQSTYVKHLSMYAVDTKLKNFLFANEQDRYIRCRSFTLQVARRASIKELSKSVSWLEQTVQADNIRLPKGFDYDAMINYFFGPSWISASQVVKLGRVNHLKIFFKALIKKFRTISTVQTIFPTVLLSGSGLGDPLEKLFSRKYITKEKRGKSEDAKDDDGPEYSENDQESENSEDKDDLEIEESDQESENSKNTDDSKNKESDQESDSSEDDRDDSQSDNDIIRQENYGNDGTYTISNGPNRMRIELVKEYKTCACGRINYRYDIRVTIEANE